MSKRCCSEARPSMNCRHHGVRECGAVYRAAPELLETLVVLLGMVEAVLTDSQLDHPVCGRRIRDALVPARRVVTEVRGGR